MQTRRDCRKTVFYARSFRSQAHRRGFNKTVFYNGQSSTFAELSLPLYFSPPFLKKLNFLTVSPEQFNVDIWLTALTILPVLFYYSVIILVIKAQGVRKSLWRPPTTKSSWKMPFINNIFVFTPVSQINCPLKGLVKIFFKNPDNSEH